MGQRKCSVDGCNEKHYAKGYCCKHYWQYRKYGEDLAPDKPTVCKVEGCNGKHRGLGYCDKHYQQYKKYGKILERTKFDSNEIIEYEDYAEIILYDKDNEEAGRTIIDLHIVDRIAPYKWCMLNGYAYNKIVGHMHRFIMNTPKDKITDHINHNTLDNRISNLRICTQLENTMNSSKRDGTSSIYKGVSWHKGIGKWIVQIRIDSKLKFIGTFDSEYDASIAYDRYAIMHYKEYANLNHSIENYYDYIFELGLDIDDFIRYK